MHDFKPHDWVVEKKYTKIEPYHLLIVDRVEGDVARVFTAGGGFVFGLKAADLRLATEAEKNPPFYRTYFTGEWMYINDKIPQWIPGITNGSRWNGWAQPYFNKETSLWLVEFQRTMTDVDQLHYDEAKDQFYLVTQEEPEKKWYCSVIEFEGARYHEIGNGWCWDELDRDSELEMAEVKQQYPDYK